MEESSVSDGLNAIRDIREFQSGASVERALVDLYDGRGYTYILKRLARVKSHLSDMSYALGYIYLRKRFASAERSVFYRSKPCGKADARKGAIGECKFIDISNTVGYTDMRK